MNDRCNGASLENDVTKTYEQKTEGKAWDEAVGTNMGLTKLNMKPEIWLNLAQEDRAILLVPGSQSPGFMGTRETERATLRLKKAHRLISVNWGISPFCPRGYSSSQPNGLRCSHYHHHSPTYRTFKLTLETREQTAAQLSLCQVQLPLKKATLHNQQTTRLETRGVSTDPCLLFAALPGWLAVLPNTGGRKTVQGPAANDI